MSTTTSVINGSNVAVDSDYLKISQEVKSQNAMDKDAFISLLTTQMQYQDPLNPMDNSEMLAQLAQFSALEQMMNVAQVGQKQLANSMVGKYVEYSHTDSQTGEVSYNVGKVDYVDISGSEPKLGIGDLTVSLSDVYSVVDSSNIQANTTAYDVIGKTVQATMKETMADGKTEDVTIEGKVESVQMKDGKPYVVIGTSDKKVTVEFENVQNIVEKTSVTGREVTGTYKNSEGKEETVTGIVEYIKINSEGTYVYVDGKMVDFKDVTVIK